MTAPFPVPPLAIDAMGADRGPSEFVAAVADARRTLPGLPPLLLVGQPEVLGPLLAEAKLDRDPMVRIHAASEVVTMDDKPVPALKQKRDSSMVRMVELVRDGVARAGVSCGNTGALMAAGTIRLRPLAGVDRPALLTVIPTRVGQFALVDAGANPDAEPRHLVHNAILGAHHMRAAYGMAKPRVGLLTIGTEEGKGNALVQATHPLLKRAAGDTFQYVGLCEGFHIWDGEIDVLVCDGFTGNVLLKTWEGLFATLKAYVKDELTANPVRMLGAALSKGAFASIRARLTPDNHAAAPLLGLKGLVFKSHGSSNRVAIRNLIRIASEVSAHDTRAAVAADIARVNAAIAAAEPPAEAAAQG